MQLCDRVWKSYPCDFAQDIADPNGLRIVFDTFSQKYATVNPEKETIWRIMTLEILISFSTPQTSAQNPHKDIVCSMSKMLHSIIDPSKTQALEADLSEIVATQASYGLLHKKIRAGFGCQPTRIMMLKTAGNRKQDPCKELNLFRSKRRSLSNTPIRFVYFPWL